MPRAMAALELLELRGRLSEGRPENVGKPRVGVFEHGPQVGHNAVGSGRHDDAELTQDAADGADACGALGEPS